GLIKNRPLDSFNIAYLYGKFSQDYSNYQVSQGLFNQTYEAVYEINYKIQWTPWSYIQPDLQIIQNPGGAHQYHNAW
ncbi:carbohydrate porin, partial [Lacticaseibacillus paracasei]